MGGELVSIFDHAQHAIDALEIEAHPCHVPDGFDVIQLENGHVYLRAFSAGILVVSYRVTSHHGLRAMAANLLETADRWELMGRQPSQRRRRRT